MDALRDAVHLVGIIVLLGADARASTVSLTASDGTGLQLLSLRARVVVDGPLALTRLHLTFRNPLHSELEGHFEMRLPAGASVSRFAMLLAEGWQESELVERRRAQEIYESFLRRQIDPALLERTAGSSFQARVYPIRPLERKQLIVAYTQDLPSARARLRLPLKGLPRLGLLRVEVVRRVGDRFETQLLERRAYLPQRDLEVAAAGDAQGLRNRQLAVARVRPQVPERSDRLGGLLVLVDTSASMGPAPGLAERLVGLGRSLATAHGARLPIQVAAFDQGVSSLFEGSAAELSASDLVARLGARGTFGASDLEGALAWAAATRGHDRLLLVTDGVPTAGRTDAEQLRAAVAALRRSFRRLDVLVAGPAPDQALLGQLVRGALPREGVVIEAGAPAATVVRRLSSGVVSGLRVSAPGATWIWPEVLDGLQPGDERLVYLELPTTWPEGRPIAIAAGDVTRAQLQRAARPLLERQWARARIEWLEERRRGAEHDPAIDLAGGALHRQLAGILDRDYARQIAALSVRHRVPCATTSFLVLETDRDYQSFGLRPAPRARVAVPRVVAGRVVVLGSLDKEVIRRAIRPHLNEVRHCYQLELQTNPRLRGRVVVEFTVESGSVTAARLQRSTLGNQAVERCIVGAVRSWLFPAAQSERMIVVTYPFMLRPKGSQEEEPEHEIPAPAYVSLPPPPPPRPQLAPPPEPPALSGPLLEVRLLIERGARAAAVRAARRWLAREPRSLMALLALGEAFQASGDTAAAARAFGSIIDLFPARAELRRVAAERLAGLGRRGLELAADSFAVALRQRPDHLTGYRLLAFALLRLGRLEAAFRTIGTGLERSRSDGARFPGVDRVLRADLGMIAAALVRRAPHLRGTLEARLARHQASLATRPSVRFVLSWESDASNLDLELVGLDRSSARGFLDDVTGGYGPECFVDEKLAPRQIKVRATWLGPTGYALGQVQILSHDGRGGVTVEDRPFVLMSDGARADLGRWEEHRPAVTSPPSCHGLTTARP